MSTAINVNALIKQVGMQNLANLASGCDLLAKVLSGLPTDEREKIRARLEYVLATEAAHLPETGRFVLSAVAQRLEQDDGLPDDATTPPGTETH